MIKTYFLICLLTVVSMTHADAQIEFELPGIHVRDFALSTDGQELYLTIESIAKDASQIIRLHQQGEVWSTPEVASFSGQFKDLEPFLHPNQLQLFFASNRNIDQSASTDHFDIWMTERVTKADPWGKATRLNEMINTPEGDEFYPSVSSNGNLYFTATKEDGLGKEDIYVSRLIKGQYTEAELLPAAVNSETFEFNAFINPDETMLLYSSYGRKDGLGGGDLYVSHKVDGQWQTATNLGKEVNSQQLDYCPFYDAQNKILYWTSNQSKLKQRSSSRKDYDQWTNLMITGSNGMSKIYSKSIDLKQPTHDTK